LKRIISWLIKPDEKSIGLSDLLIFTACDSLYFDYAASLVRSADVFSPGSKFILHLINPEKKVLQQVEQLRRVITTTDLYVSIEKTDLNSMDGEGKRTYYACARFLRIAELLKEYSCEFLVVDSDSLIVNPINRDFTNKEEADICLIRRDLDGVVDVRLAVATGTVYVRNRAASLDFFILLSNKLHNHFLTENINWFLDQVLFHETMMELVTTCIRNIKKSYADWTFRKSSILWAGKGDLKTQHIFFAAIQQMLSLDEFSQNRALSRLYSIVGSEALVKNNFFDKILKIKDLLKPRMVIFIPRLDLPWKRPSKNVSSYPAISDETLDLRLWWKVFATNVVSSFQANGFFAEIIEVPAWEINEVAVNNSAADIAFVPHRCHKDFELSKVRLNVEFYMQEYFAWVFVVNKRGWSAASSLYPININAIKCDFPSDKYKEYQYRLAAGKLTSKFYQAKSQTIESLIELGQLPDTKGFATKKPVYIFFPLQIPHDQSIRYFSSVEEYEVVNALLDWSENSKIPIVFKPHPANEKSMRELLELIKFRGGFISNGNIHDLITYSSAVYTINSGVGFEALLHSKPIVTFGRVEYDCVTFKADVNSLDKAWFYCLYSDPISLIRSYSTFIQWFLAEYSYDLSDKASVSQKLRHLVKSTKKSLSKTK
jgi:hypothetical protein